MIEYLSTKGNIYLFDDDMKEALTSYRWYERHDGYLHAVIEGEMVSAHRYTFGMIPAKCQVRFISNNRYDVRRENLVLVYPRKSKKVNSHLLE